MVDWTELPGITEGGGRRNYIVGAVYVIVILAVIGAATGDPEDNEPAAPEDSTPTEEVEAATDTPTATDTPVVTDGGTTPASTPTSEPTPASASTLQSIQDVDGYYDETATELSGSGQTVTNSFDHPGGLLVMDYEHDGSSNFIVEVYDEESGERVDIPINKIGSIDAATGVPLEAGEYSFDIDADGAWSVTRANPDVPDEDIQAPPASVSGEGPDVVGPIEFDGSFTATGSHSGDGNFIVWVRNEAEGDQFSGTNVFNEIGEVDNAENRESHSGVAWVVVDADGEWELAFE